MRHADLNHFLGTEQSRPACDLPFGRLVQGEMHERILRHVVIERRCPNRIIVRYGSETAITYAFDPDADETTITLTGPNGQRTTRCTWQEFLPEGITITVIPADERRLRPAGSPWRISFDGSPPRMFAPPIMFMEPPIANF